MFAEDGPKQGWRQSTSWQGQIQPSVGSSLAAAPEQTSQCADKGAGALKPHPRSSGALRGLYRKLGDL